MNKKVFLSALFFSIFFCMTFFVCLNVTNAQTFTNPLAFNSVQDVLNNVFYNLTGIIGVLAMVFIVIGAFFILTSAGNPEQMTRGKNTIAMALVGLALGVGAPSFLKEIASAIGWANAPTSNALTLSEISLNVLTFLLGLAGTVAIIMLVIGGVMYLTAAGDESRIDKGKSIFKNSMIGIVIIFASMILVQQVAKFFM